MSNIDIITNIINNLKKCNIDCKDNNSILDIINTFITDDIDKIYYYKLNADINYNDIIDIWDNFLDNDMFRDFSIYLKNKNKLDKNNSSLKLLICENELAVLLEKLFNNHLETIQSNLLLFYIKNENKLLVMLKSYLLLLDDNEIKLPYWNNIISDKIDNNINNKINKLLDEDENLCILSFTI
jgi:hypothetical protein